MDNEKPQAQDDFYEGFIDFEAELKKSNQSVHNPHGLYDDFIDMDAHLQNQERVKSNSVVGAGGLAGFEGQDDFEMLDADDDLGQMSNSVKLDSGGGSMRKRGNAVTKKGGSKFKNLLSRKKKEKESVNLTKIEVY